MNIFEKHFSMLKKNEEIFEKFKARECIGIKISENAKKDFFKTGKELLTIEKEKQFMEIRSIHYYNVIIKKLKEYTLPEWIVCLNEKVLLEYAVPVFSRVLNEYPMLCGMNCEWQVLYEITKIKQCFWDLHKEWKVYFVKIIDNIFLEYKQEDLMTVIPKEYLHQFKNYSQI